MHFLRASASAIQLAASGLDQVPAASSTTSTSRSLLQNFNYEEIEPETSLSRTLKNQPVTFTATFTNLWTEDRHPFSFPSSNAHWSPMVIASHSDAYSMWCDGCTATSGLESIAETGGTSTLRNEISAEQGEKIVLDQKTAPGLGTPVGFRDESSPDGSLCVDEDHPLVSAISMIAPSPDWFSGLYNLPLWKENSDGDDVWYNKFQAYVYAWDAGTEEGDSYSLGNAATSPKEGMLPFMAGNTADEVFVSENSSGDLHVLPVGIITFELQESTPECTSMSDASTFALVDTAQSFVVRIRRKGAPMLKIASCKGWVSKRPNKRCGKKTRDESGKPTGTRVRDLCPRTCMSK